ncbi:MAG: hypothetical protein Q4G43_17170, partial [Mobilicoccus sp.]|nr:hypothetical protein [Mobilicoccus sp.]
MSAPEREPGRAVEARHADAVVFGEPVPVQRRPILPRQVRPVVQATVVGVRESSTRAGHAAAFHGARVPVYGARLVGRAPVGAWRLAAWTSRWVLDVEGRRVRATMSGAEAGSTPEANAYLRVNHEHHQAMKTRAVLLLALLACATVFLGVAWLAYGTVALVVATVAVLVVLGWIGRGEATMRVGAAVHHPGAPRVTSALIVDALRTLGLAELNRALKDDPGAVRFVAPICRDGAGWRADIDLPGGVTAGDVVERRDRLASGLRRPEGCVWPEPDTGAHAGRLVLWVGDSVMSKARPVPWPLERAGRTDVFAPIPFGVDQRGRPVPLTLMFASMV